MSPKNLKNQITSQYIAASQRFLSPNECKKRCVMVYVEGYEDIPFWREILNDYEREDLRFEVNVPVRDDMAKGKRVLMSMAGGVGENMMLCMDSDFDYIFQGATIQSKTILSNKYIIHTRAYSIENLLCYAPSLNKIAVRAAKNDTQLFDIGQFLLSYSKIIYPLFLWYSYSALLEKRHIFVLADLKNAIRLNYVDIANQGFNTLNWLKRSVKRRIVTLEKDNGDLINNIKEWRDRLNVIGIERDNCYLYINGHILMDNVLVVINSVVDKLRDEQMAEIRNSSIKGTTLNIEMSNYKNSLLKVSDLLRNSVGYRGSIPFKQISEQLCELFIKKEDN